METTTTSDELCSEDLTLNILSEKTTEELDIIYRDGTLPTSFKSLDGHAEGRLLAIRFLEKTPLFRLIALYAKSSIFPWGGKSFEAFSDTEGTGINHLKLIGQHSILPFETRIEPSEIDGEDCIVLDYDLPENLWPARIVRDELREVSPGIFIGPMILKSQKSGTLILWFAVDHN